MVRKCQSALTECHLSVLGGVLTFSSKLSALFHPTWCLAKESESDQEQEEEVIVSLVKGCVVA